MPNTSPTFDDYVTDEPSSLGQRITNAAAQAMDQVAELPELVKIKIDERRGGAADGLQRAASALRESTEGPPAGEPVSGIVCAAAENLAASATYVRGSNVNKMMSDCRRIVGKNPGTFVVAAALVGFLVARAFSRDNG